MESSLNIYREQESGVKKMVFGIYLVFMVFIHHLYLKIKSVYLLKILLKNALKILKGLHDF